MPKYFLQIILGLIILSTAIFYLSQSFIKKDVKISPTPSNTSSLPPKFTPFQAKFLIYTNGTRRIFTDPKYHNKSDEVYIEKQNPQLINVKKRDITWENFFTTLPMELTKDCLTTGTSQTFCTNNTHSLKFYINGNEEKNALDKIILPDDKLLVTYGPISDPALATQLESFK